MATHGNGSGAHGKEGVISSSLIEGFEKSPVDGDFSFLGRNCCVIVCDRARLPSARDGRGSTGSTYDLDVVPKHVGSSGPPWRLSAVEAAQSKEATDEASR